ncbi:MAG: site-specific DNA-methyltransferase [Armatimonadota bacterium]|nr:site-specific DNA-methyltransferase [Armatimonadota bacterium]
MNWQAWWPQVLRVCKEQAVIVLFSAQPFTTDLINSNRTCFRYELIWHKTLAAGWLDANRRPLRAHENILIFARKPIGSTYNVQKEPGHKPYTTRHIGPVPHYGKQYWESVSQSLSGERYPRSVLLFSNRKTSKNSQHRYLHPTQKPLELMQWLVRGYSNPGETVLDPFMGSGTTGAACLATGRKFIGIESDYSYYKVARARLCRSSLKQAV